MTDFFAGTILGIFLTLFVMVYIFGARDPSYWYDEAVSHGCGEYSSTTGVFQWKDKE